MKKNETDFFVSFPLWFKVLIPFGSFFVVSVLGIYLFRSGFQYLSIIFWVVVFCFCFFFFGGIWLLAFTFKSFHVFKRGVRYKILGKDIAFIEWGNIIGLTRPKSGIPYDLVYLTTKNGGKVSFFRSMNNYRLMAKKINENSQDLRDFNP